MFLCVCFTHFLTQTKHFQSMKGHWYEMDYYELAELSHSLANAVQGGYVARIMPTYFEFPLPLNSRYSFSWHNNKSTICTAHNNI